MQLESLLEAAGGGGMIGPGRGDVGQPVEGGGGRRLELEDSPVSSFGSVRAAELQEYVPSRTRLARSSGLSSRVLRKESAAASNSPFLCWAIPR